MGRDMGGMQDMNRPMMNSNRDMMRSQSEIMRPGQDMMSDNGISRDMNSRDMIESNSDSRFSRDIMDGRDVMGSSRDNMMGGGRENMMGRDNMGGRDGMIRNNRVMMGGRNS